MPKKVLVAVPPQLLEQIDFIAQVESRTRSDLIREALRRYLHNFKQQNPMPYARVVVNEPEIASAPGTLVSFTGA